ncbi:MAG: L,D-transpeptidase [Desulfomonilaceae bacterium]|nr:L,D-transpeptidase [Desulfomonilaceae bacterium]
MDPIVGMESPRNPRNVFRSPSLVDRDNMQALIMPGDHLGSVGNIPTSLEDRFRRLEIEVSHSGHHLKLIGESFSGRRQVLHECRVGLGSSEFPTPVGVYFVTHVYDQDPWWIPPPNRAWAAGQSPSRKVYGGVMAPLLKKRSVRTRGNPSEGSEDKIEGQVRLEDYGYRFHGTNAPRSIGRNQSHGCVRMLPKDVKQVAELIKEHVGTLDRLESVNGSFVLLKSPIRLNLVK